MANYKQCHTNSCGAVALMCAASELGKTWLPQAGKFAFMEPATPLTGNAAVVDKALRAWNGEAFPGGIHTGAQTVEDALYAVTSGDLNSYSVPSRVVGCAKLLGLKVDKLYANPGLYTAALKLAYRDQLDACRKQVDIVDGPSPGPAGHQRELVVLSTCVVGLHWVMRRPVASAADDEFMDPADGRNYRNFEALNTGMKLYGQTGISVIVSG